MAVDFLEYLDEQDRDLLHHAAKITLYELYNANLPVRDDNTHDGNNWARWSTDHRGSGMLLRQSIESAMETAEMLTMDSPRTTTCGGQEILLESTPIMPTKLA